MPDTTGTGANTATDQNNGTTTTTDATNTTTDTTNTNPPAGETPEQKATRLEAEVARLEREKADVRVNKQGDIANKATQKAVAALAKSLGIELPGGEELTVESLTEKLNEQTGKTEKATEKANSTARELAVYKAATPDGVDVDRLTDSRTFNQTIEALDPSDKDFDAKIKAAVSAAVTKDPSLKSRRQGGGTQRSGGENFGGSGGSTPLTKDQFVALSTAEKSKLFLTNRSEYNRLMSA